MIRKVKLALLSLATLFMFSAPVVVTSPAVAQTTQQQINDCLRQGSNFDFRNNVCVRDVGQPESRLNAFIRSALQVLSIVVGVVAVVMIIIGGFRYVVSGGKQESVAAAKNTILYGIIGLVIVALAQVIVQFVLTRTT